MCDKCNSKEYCNYRKKGDIHNCLKRRMSSYAPNNKEWNNHIANWNGWFQDL